jgi:pSer/pThr/pTyr-binding forkhead associated (FHA) protein
MTITIELVNADIPEHEITLTGFPVMIGRSPEADVQLEDSCVSRQHCEIDEMDGRPIVRDLDSKNGTFVNGAAVQQAVVQPEDRITVGGISLRARCNTRRTKTAAGRED